MGHPSLVSRGPQRVPVASPTNCPKSGASAIDARCGGGPLVRREVAAVVAEPGAEGFDHGRVARFVDANLRRASAEEGLRRAGHG